MLRLFKPGDKVVLKTGGPLMEVAGYMMQSNFINPSQVYTPYVECIYYEPFEKSWKKEIFHQDSLKKAELEKPVWLDNIKKLILVAQPTLLN